MINITGTRAGILMPLTIDHHTFRDEGSLTGRTLLLFLVIRVLHEREKERERRDVFILLSNSEGEGFNSHHRGRVERHRVIESHQKRRWFSDREARDLVGRGG
jgi:hypothetical protein